MQPSQVRKLEQFLVLSARKEHTVLGGRGCPSCFDYGCLNIILKFQPEQISCSLVLGQRNISDISNFVHGNNAKDHRGSSAADSVSLLGYATHLVLLIMCTCAVAKKNRIRLFHLGEECSITDPVDPQRFPSQSTPVCSTNSSSDPPIIRLSNAH